MPESRASRFGVGDFLARLAFALALVLITYNPSRYSFAHWVSGAFSDGALGPLHYFVGVILLIGWVIFIRTTWESIGWLGVILAAAFLGTLVWVLVDAQLLSVDSLSAIAWVVLGCVSLVLAVGMSWGHMQKRASGQVDVDDVET